MVNTPKPNQDWPHWTATDRRIHDVKRVLMLWLSAKSITMHFGDKSITAKIDGRPDGADYHVEASELGMN